MDVVIVKSVDQLVLEDSSFLGQNASGTALEIVDTYANIVNTSFISNNVGNFRGPIKVLEYWKAHFNMSAPVYAHIGGALIATQSNVIEQNLKETVLRWVEPYLLS